jgi:hypothetical protein
VVGVVLGLVDGAVEVGGVVDVLLSFWHPATPSAAATASKAQILGFMHSLRSGLRGRGAFARCRLAGTMPCTMSWFQSGHRPCNPLSYQAFHREPERRPRARMSGCHDGRLILLVPIAKGRGNSYRNRRAPLIVAAAGQGKSGAESILSHAACEPAGGASRRTVQLLPAPDRPTNHSSRCTATRQVGPCLMR